MITAVGYERFCKTANGGNCSGFGIAARSSGLSLERMVALDRRWKVPNINAQDVVPVPAPTRITASSPRRSLVSRSRGGCFLGARGRRFGIRGL